MDSLWAQLVLQLGISGLIVFAAYKIGMKLIDRWASTEAKRTEAWSRAEDIRTSAIQEGFRADTSAHNELAKYMHVLTGVLSRVEGKIDAAFDLTPVKGVRDYEPRELHQLSSSTEEAVPVMRPTPAPGGGYSVKRPKTSG